MPHSYRCMLTKNKPIETVEDIRNLKLRLSASKILQDTFKQLHAAITMVPWGEVYTSLQTGLVEAVEASNSAMYIMNFWEVTNYLAITNHHLMAMEFMINEKFFQSLPKDIQKSIIDATNQTVGALEVITPVVDKKYRELIEKKVKRVTYPDLEPFQKAMEPLYDSFGKETGTTELIQKIKAMQKEELHSAIPDFDKIQ